MHFRLNKKINIVLTLLLFCYAMLAVGHFGHSHFYGKADPGYCNSQCENPEHFDAKPICKGFPLDLILGITVDNLDLGTILPTLIPESTSTEFQGSANYYFEDNSRAPPTC